MVEYRVELYAVRKAEDEMNRLAQEGGVRIQPVRMDPGSALLSLIRGRNK